MDLPSFVLPAYGTIPVVFMWSSVAALGATVGAEDPEERILKSQLQPPKLSLHKEFQCKAQRNKNSANCWTTPGELWDNLLISHYFGKDKKGKEKSHREEHSINI